MAAVFKGLEDFAGRFPAMALQMVRDVVSAALDEMGSRSRSAAEAMSPVGPSGGLRGGWSLLGTGKAAVDSLQPIRLVNVAGQDGGSFPVSYPILISQGRRKGPSGRMLGSTQAPRGIRGPVIGQLKRSEDDILGRAIAAVESRAG